MVAISLICIPQKTEKASMVVNVCILTVLSFNFDFFLYAQNTGKTLKVIISEKVV